MSVDMLVALTVFCLVSSITPGPNNLMLLSSGINFGVRRSLRHLWGVQLGFNAMVILLGIGLAEVVKLYPSSLQILKYVSVAYLCYLAYKIANSGEVADKAHQPQPLSFIQAVLFQWVNPKAWVMVLSALAVYAPDHTLMSVLIISLSFILVGVPSSFTWLLAGKSLRRFLANPIKLRIFNIVMAALLVASFIPMLD